MFCVFIGACPSSVTFSDPTSERPLPDKVGVWGGGGAVGLRSTQEHRCTLFGGARRAHGSGADCVEEIVGGRCGRVVGVDGTPRYVDSAGCWLLRSYCLAYVLC